MFWLDVTTSKDECTWTRLTSVVSTRKRPFTEECFVFHPLVLLFIMDGKGGSCSYISLCILCIFAYSDVQYLAYQVSVLCSVLGSPLWFPLKNDVRFILISSCLYESTSLIYAICVCLRIVVSNKYCVVFLFCLSVSCVTYVTRFAGLSLFDCPFGTV